MIRSLKTRWLAQVVFKCTFGDYLAPVLACVLIAAHTTDNVDFGVEPENKIEGHEND